MVSIDSLPLGVPARLAAIGGEGEFRRRLLEMGFLPGTPVHLVRRPEIGGLIEVELRGCRVSLRRTDAASILVDAI
jgi:ferrous iron transport protein A